MTEREKIKWNFEVDNPFFELPVVGRFTHDQVKVIDSKERIARPPEIKKKIERAWKEGVKKAKESGIRLTDNEIVLLLEKTIEDGGKLGLGLGRGRYKDFVGTYEKRTDPEWTGWVPQKLSVASVVKTSDGYLALNIRSGVFKYPGWIGSYSGASETTDRNEKGDLDPFITARREITEESAIPDENIASLVCLGVMRDPKTDIEDVLFQAETDLTKKQIEELQEASQQNGENGEGVNVFIPKSEEQLMRKALDFSTATVSDALALLSICGWQEYGDDWMEYLIKRLKKRDEVYREFDDSQMEEIKKRKKVRIKKINSGRKNPKNSE